VLARPYQLDEELSGQPSAFMAQAIFCAFRSVSIIATKYPAVLGQLVHQLPFADRLRASQSYTATSNCPLLKSDAIMPVEPMPLPQFILLAGSNGDCQFLQELRIQDAKQAHQQRTRSPCKLPSQQCHGAALGEDDLDSADEDWTWRDHPISSTEFHWLLVGLIAEDRPAREPLWELVKHQLELQRRGTRLSADAYYVRLAVMYANHRALAQLLNNGWNMNGGMAGLFCSPLQLALCIEKAGLMLPIEPHKCYNLGCLRLPQNNFATLTDEKKNSLGQSISLLGARGGTGRPRVLSLLLDSPLAGMTLTGIALVIHLVVLPLGIGFAFQPEAPEARRLKFLYLYTWSLSAATNVFFLLSFTLRYLLLLSPFACFSPKTYGWSRVWSGYSLHALCLVLILGQYIAVPWLFYSKALLNDTIYKLFLAGIIITGWLMFSVLLGFVTSLAVVGFLLIRYLLS
jgi:hypothetical protein